MKKIALVIGATGVVGKELVKQLIDCDQVSKIITITRRPNEHNSIKVINEVINFDEIEAHKELIAGDILFSCLGTTIKLAGSIEKQRVVDVDYQYRFARLALENGIKHYLLVSSSGASSTSTRSILK